MKPTVIKGGAQALVDRMKRDVYENDRDVWALIEGPEGSGKSCLALRLCILLEDPWPIHDRLFYRPTPYTKASKQLGRGAALLGDEGKRFFFNRRGMHGDVTDFMDDLYEARARNQFHLFCDPDPDTSDKIVRDHRIRYRIETDFPRGWATAKVSDADSGHAKEIIKFPFASLEGTWLWDTYLELSGDAKNQLDDSPKEPQKTVYEQAAADWYPRFRRIAQLINRAEPEAQWVE